METNTEIQHVDKKTFFGVAGILVGLSVAANGYIAISVFNQVDSLEARTDARIAKVEARLDNVDDDIRAILVGIEQVKARLGIIESN